MLVFSRRGRAGEPVSSAVFREILGYFLAEACTYEAYQCQLAFLANSGWGVRGVECLLAYGVCLRIINAGVHVVANLFSVSKPMIECGVRHVAFTFALQDCLSSA